MLLGHVFRHKEALQVNNGSAWCFLKMIRSWYGICQAKRGKREKSQLLLLVGVRWGCRVSLMSCLGQHEFTKIWVSFSKRELRGRSCP